MRTIYSTNLNVRTYNVCECVSQGSNQHSRHPLCCSTMYTAPIILPKPAKQNQWCKQTSTQQQRSSIAKPSISISTIPVTAIAISIVWTIGQHLLRAEQSLIQRHCNSQHENRVYARQGVQGVCINVIWYWCATLNSLLNLIQLSYRLGISVLLQWHTTLQVPTCFASFDTIS